MAEKINLNECVRVGDNYLPNAHTRIVPVEIQVK